MSLFFPRHVQTTLNKNKYGDIDMIEAPERSYIDWTHDGEGFAGDVTHYSEHLGPEYIRADLVPKWQPIETAPRQDQILFTSNKVDGWFEMGRVDVFGGYCSGFGCHSLEHNPTHWMPLPSPPKYE
jgi:hypothetical protein